MMRALFAGLALMVATPTLAKDEEGIPVTVAVVDADNQIPISTAVVRHPEEMDRHPVNTTTGAFTASVLYMLDGREVFFQKGDELIFEVSAPGYINQKVTYVVRKRKNRFVVPLKKMDWSVDDEEEDPVIQFGRDRPIDGQPIEPSQ